MTEDWGTHVVVDWSKTFNTAHTHWSIDGAQAVAKIAGYPYLCWNGRLYETETLKHVGIIIDKS